MSTPDVKAAPNRRRRNLLMIGGALGFVALRCICSLTWFAWTYGDAIVEGLLNAVEITY